jgi:formylglycine-generating enzyme required for sulfatase activity
MTYRSHAAGSALGTFIFLVLLFLAPVGYAQVNASPPKLYTNSIGMEFALIPAGEFLMGATDDDEDAVADEKPRHQVSISKSFYLGRFEVTQEEYFQVIGHNPSQFQGDNHPVENVSFTAATAFIEALNQKERHSRYHLPTEAQWEYAARAGTYSLYYFGDDTGLLGSYAWYGANSGEEFHHHQVGGKLPNPWSLFDMHGNVWEWLQDWYGEDYYQNCPTVDPPGERSSEYKVIRSGSALDSPALLRSAARYKYNPESSNKFIGFRLALSLE